MKKTLIITNLLWMSIVGFITLSSQTKTPAPILKPGDVVLNYSKKEFQSMPLATAVSIASNYQKTRLPLIKENLNIDDAHAIWFSLDRLKQFIWIIENNAVNKVVKGKKEDLGVKIYYAAYPTKDAMPNAMSKYGTDDAGKHTLFMVPTILKNGKNINFDPVSTYREMKNGIKKEIISLEEENPNMVFKSAAGDATILNEGNLCPVCN